MDEGLIEAIFSVDEPFQAPEVLQGPSLACMASDRWAAGVVILQLICQRPLHNLLDSLPGDHPARTNKRAELLTSADIGGFMALPSSLPVGPGLAELVLDLLTVKPTERPTDDQALMRVKEAIASLQGVQEAC